MRSSSISFALLVAASQCLATSCDFDGGFSVRRSDGCGDDTVNCKAGASSRCCPQGSYCFYTDPDQGGNAYCCPENSDCLKDILDYPQCAYGNRTIWVGEGVDAKQSFCCDSGYQGVIRSDGVGAACSQGSSISKGETRASRFEPDATCVDTSSTSTNSADATTSEATQTTSGESSAETSADTDTDDDSSISGGAIAGIVIGSVAGVALIAAAAFWLFRRRSRSQAEQKPPYSNVEYGEDNTNHYATGGYPPTELDTSSRPPQELAGKEIQREEQGPRQT
ncbi:hypothetical protein CEP54_013704 [Fusarium duplospermum]|uniref:Mid2 domain-containing protein n=1 Tax=Fusarium duplospermum TaxID=1325734 RepID=A0A428P173_9HYPO|nr:hypothetical protein CEP54_013704 [Fusarium duplospermum]